MRLKIRRISSSYCVCMRAIKSVVATAMIIFVFVFTHVKFQEENNQSQPMPLVLHAHVDISNDTHARCNETIAGIRLQKTVKYPRDLLQSRTDRITSFEGCGKECTQLRDIQKYINCPSIMEGDSNALVMAKIYMKYHPQAVIPNRVLSDNDCSSYKNNPFYPNEPNGGEEGNFSIAYSIVVHKNPAQLEQLIRTIYWPQNVYCIHVDKKSASDLLGYVRQLSRCFPNIIMTDQEDVIYGGYSRLKADLNCMFDLLRHRQPWKYIINLTGQEFPLKTNRELVKILEIYNGSNDIEGVSKHTTGAFISRFANKWKIGQRHKMVLVRNGSKSTPPGNITLIKGSAFGAFSRQFVEFIFADDTVKQFLTWLQDVWSPDEFFWATLNSLFHNPQLHAPGGYRGVPERKPWLAKHVAWPPRDKCSGNKVRSICILSSGDLPRLISRKELFANKFYMEKDYIVLHCLEEWIRNKTRNTLPFDYQFYRELPFINTKSKKK